MGTAISLLERERVMDENTAGMVLITVPAFFAVTPLQKGLFMVKRILGVFGERYQNRVKKQCRKEERVCQYQLSQLMKLN